MKFALYILAAAVLWAAVPAGAAFAQSPASDPKPGAVRAAVRSADFPCELIPETDNLRELGLSPVQLRQLEGLNKRYFAIFEAEYKKELMKYMTAAPEIGSHEFGKDGSAGDIGAEYERETRRLLTPLQRSRYASSPVSGDRKYDLASYSFLYPKPWHMSFFADLKLTPEQLEKVSGLNDSFFRKLLNSAGPSERAAANGEYGKSLLELFDPEQKERYRNKFRGSVIGFRTFPQENRSEHTGLPLAGPFPRPAAPDAPAAPETKPKPPAPGIEAPRLVSGLWRPDNSAGRETEIPSALPSYEPPRSAMLPSQTLITPEMRERLFEKVFFCRIDPDSDYALELGLSPDQRQKLIRLNDKYFALFEAEYQKLLQRHMERIRDTVLTEQLPQQIRDTRCRALGEEYKNTFKALLDPSQRSGHREPVELLAPVQDDLTLSYPPWYPTPFYIYRFRGLKLSAGQKEQIAALGEELAASLAKCSSPQERSLLRSQYESGVVNVLSDLQRERFIRFPGGPDTWPKTAAERLLERKKKALPAEEEAK